MKTINQVAVKVVATLEACGVEIEHKAMAFECGAIGIGVEDLEAVEAILANYPEVVVIGKTPVMGAVVIGYSGPNSQALMQTRLIEIAKELGSEELAELLAIGDGTGAKEVMERGDRTDLLAVGVAAGIVVAAEQEDDFSPVNDGALFQLLRGSIASQYPAMTEDQATQVLADTEALVKDWVLKYAA